MSIEKTDFEAIAEADLEELVEAQTPEGLRIDFKLSCYGMSDSDKREFLKDVVAFANSHGGHIVLGVEENEGIAKNIIGIDIDTDKELLRMEQLIRNATDPPVLGVRMRAIPLENGKKVLLLRIPRSWNPPHRVTSNGINRFYTRHSSGVHEPSIEELRSLFNQSAAALERAREFRNQRIRSVIEGEGHRPLSNEGRLFLHIVPTASFTGLVNIDVEHIYNKKNAFWPLRASSATSRFNYYGFIYERGGDENIGYTQIFRNGILEATHAKIVREIESRRIVPGYTLEKSIFDKFHEYIDGLKEIGVPTPLIILLTYEGIKGATYGLHNDFYEEEMPFPLDVIYLPECIVENYGSKIEYQKSVRPAFDALWNAIGRSKDLFFNDTGEWVGKMV